METVGRSDGDASLREFGSRDERRLARETILSLGATLIAGGLNLVVPIVVTRELSGAGAGVYFEAVALFMVLLNVGTLGADTGVLRSLPQALARDEPHTVTAYLRTAFKAPMLVTSVTAVALAVTAPWIAAAIVHASESHEQMMVHCLYVVAGALPPSVAYLLGTFASRGLHSIRILVLVDKVGKGALQFVLVIAAVYALDSAVGAVLGWTAAYALFLLVVGRWLVRYLRHRLSGPDDAPRLDREARRRLVRSFWRFSAPRAISRVCTVAMQRADVLLVGALLGPVDAAVYAAATRFVVLGALLAQAIQQVMAPKISEAIELDDIDRARSIYRTTTTWLTLLAWPVYLLAANFAALLLNVFGEGYDRGWSAAVILCLTMLLATACGPVDTMLLMAGRSVLSLTNALVALVIMLAVDLLLIPALGILGAAIGWSCALALKNVLALAQVRTILAMHPFGYGFCAAATVALLSYGALPLVVVRATGDNLPALCVASLAGGVLFVTLVWRKRVLFGLDNLRTRRRASS